jgi:phosphate transport system protein
MDELRRAYHDRLADLHASTVEVVDIVVDGVAGVTQSFLAQDLDAAAVIEDLMRKTRAQRAGVEAEVLDLLAQQAPVARDLRMVLAALRIAEVADLCLGLIIGVAQRVTCDRDVATPTLRAVLEQMGVETGGVLAQANAAWRVAEPDLSFAVAAAAADCRTLQRQFLAELIGLHDAPVDAAVDLGLVARAYERLTDHAEEIAERVRFAATGIPG